ncbi:MAG TPA: pyruvate dehydrogenase complex dihydrolipoamide acetyltransferase, partial [Planctomycetaceae bacterium]|nr:pyruvate dehydrogenase complex dihydrolipoamide acetyltransferase [Planctomycetaceae bacterium]
SDTMTEGVLLKWLKKEGDVVEAGDIIAEAESDKATMELEAFDAGVLKKILVPEGGKVPVGGTIAIIADDDEDISDVLQEESQAKGRAAGEEAAPVTEATSVPESIQATPVPDRTAPDELLTTDSVRIKASPLARKMAAERNIDLRKVTGTGTGGRIIKKDILEYEARMQKSVAEQPPAAAAPIAPGKEIPLSGMRAAIARRMTQSKTSVPHFYLVMEIDMKNAIEFRKSLNDLQSEIKISFNDLILKAVAQALQKHPQVNGSFAGDKIVYHNHVDLGVAVALDDGLITPVIRNCESKSIGQIAREVRELAMRAKERKLKPEEYSNSTFSISNLGMYGIEEFSAIINPPEAAILAVGAIVQKPVVQDGEIVIGHRMKVTLSCDHRIVDGAIGSLFLREFKRLMENPLALMM